MKNIGCVILAGGKSSRMGRDKANLEIKDQTFIKKLTKELDFFEEKMIARGANESFDGIDWNIIPDLYEGCGPIGGLHAALKHCKSEALVCLPCDLPLLETSFVQWMVSHLKDGYDAIICRSLGGRTHPLCGIYRKTAVEILEAQIAGGDYRMMYALEKMKVKYVVADSESKEAQLWNVNTPKDYESLQKLAGKYDKDNI